MNTQKSFVIRKEDVDATLASVPFDGKHLLEPLKSLAAQGKLPINILEDQNVSNDAEVHRHESDLWYCLSGEVTFVCGGEMVDPWFGKKPDGSPNENELKAKEIRGGTEVILKAGDWLWIPAGEPHSHSASGTVRLVIIKIPSVSQI